MEGWAPFIAHSGAQWLTPIHPCEASWHHLLPTKSGGGTLQVKTPFCKHVCVAEFTIEVKKWLLC
jgi:hypothetical protein